MNYVKAPLSSLRLSFLLSKDPTSPCGWGREVAPAGGGGGEGRARSAGKRFGALGGCSGPGSPRRPRGTGCSYPAASGGGPCGGGGGLLPAPKMASVASPPRRAAHTPIRASLPSAGSGALLPTLTGSGRHAEPDMEAAAASPVRFKSK